MTGKQPARVAVIGGFSEGRHHADKLARALKADGFVVVKKPTEAEVVVAHSGGCYLMPGDCQGKTILLIDPPCGFQQPLQHHARAKIRQDFAYHKAARQIHRFVHKNLWNLWYIPARAAHNVRMARRVKQFAKILPTVQAQKVVVIVNKHDPWASNLAPQNLPRHSTYAFLSLGGPHDDVWIHPERYVDIIRSVHAA